MLLILVIELMTIACIFAVIVMAYALCSGRVVELLQYLGLAPKEEGNDFWDDEIECCDSCGESVSNEEMHHAYPFNGFESWGEALYSECTHCHQVELDRQNAEWSNRKIGK